MQGHWEDWAQNRWTGQYHKLKSECRPETNNDFRWLRLIQPCSQLRQLHGPVALNRFYSIHPCEEFILGSSPTVYKSMKQKEQHKKALLKIKWCSGFRQSILCLNPLELKKKLFYNVIKIKQQNRLYDAFISNMLFLVSESDYSLLLEFKVLTVATKPSRQYDILIFQNIIKAKITVFPSYRVDGAISVLQSLLLSQAQTEDPMVQKGSGLMNKHTALWLQQLSLYSSLCVTLWHN